MPCVGAEEEVSVELLALFSGDGKRIVVVIEAFLDESGTHKESPIVCVGAWLGEHWQWKKFLSHWDQKPFHAKDPKCKALKHGLFEAIKFGELGGFVAWMEPQDYVQQMSPLAKSQMGNAYAICTFACALGICKYLQANKLGKVAFVIEAGQPNVEWVRGVLEHLQARQEFRGTDLGITAVATAKKQDFIQLCTADFLVHSRTSDPDWFERLHDTGKVWQEHITAEKLAGLSEHLGELSKSYRRAKLKNKHANAKSQTA